MLDAYLKWTVQVKQAIALWGAYTVKGAFDEVVVAGMGGSGIVGDYLQVLSTASGTIPVYVVKSHTVPGFIDRGTLFIAVSYSGDTLETVLALRHALRKRVTAITVSSGGALREEALKNNLLHIPLPQGLLPRVSLPAMLYSVLGVLDASGYPVVPKGEASASVEFLEEYMDECVEVSENLANWLFVDVVLGSRLPVIASHSPLEALAIRGKNEFNENSKLVVKVDVAPEWMHNDIVGYEKPVYRKYGVLEIVDPENTVGVKLVNFMERVYSENNAVYFRLELRGRNMLEKLMYGSLILGLASVKLAERRLLDPAETKSILLYKRSVREIFSE
ncbi:MAG: SIS domain-containing protein [Desulfurococcaceae archaeon]